MKLPDLIDVSGEMTAGAADAVKDLKRWCLILSTTALLTLCLVAYAVVEISGSADNAHHAAVAAKIAATDSDHAISELEELAARQARDEHHTCTIQRRGLPAGHQLADTMQDIYLLLKFVPVTKKTPPHVALVFHELENHLHKYTITESKQPETRACQS